MNPVFPYGPPFLPPGKPFLFPPALTPSDILLNRFAKSTAATDATKTASDPPALPPNPALIASYFKTKKDEFLTKLFEKISAAAAAATDAPEISARSVATEDPALQIDPSAIPPVIDASFFLNKKFDFLAKLFKILNSTTPATPVEASTSEPDVSAAAAPTTTLKPTIVPPNFWFPFPKPPKPPKAPKPPKPSKAPKPPKPPKPEKILKEALDTLLLQSLLADLGVDPTDTSLTNKRAAVAPLSKKAKAKKVKTPEEEITEFRIPPKVDPELYSEKASSFLDKLFKTLNKTDPEELTNYVTPKATVIPLNFWTQPSDTEYTSKLDAFLDLLMKSLNATDSQVKPAKSKKPDFVGKKPDFVSKKIKTRASFLDELLHRIPPSTTTTEKPKDDCNCAGDSSNCCCDGKCVTAGSNKESPVKSERSLIFKPFGTGYWIPQYLYAAKMGLYLDQLMDTINSAAADDLTGSPSLKRSVAADSAEDNLADLPPKDAALNLIISELTELKDNIVEAFAEGIKASKVVSPTSKPFGPPGKSFKKPFWGPKPSPTPDPVAQIQKRIDLINDVFDKLTKVEKTLLFTADPDDPKVIKNITQLLKSEPTKPTEPSKKVKATVVPPSFWEPDPTAVDTPNYYLAKTQEFLQNLYASKLDTSDSDDE